MKRKVRKVGRPTKQTPRVEDRLETSLRAGLPRWAACASAKITYPTFKTWLDTKPEFLALVSEWEAAAVADLVERVKREPKGNQFLLARRFRPDYGDRLTVENQGEQKLTIEVVERDAKSRNLPADPPPPAKGD